MIGKLLICVALVGLSVVGYGYSTTQKQTQVQTTTPKHTTQEIYIVYSQMDIAEAMALQCEQVGSTSSYVCPLIGAGGGHAFKD